MDSVKVTLTASKGKDPVAKAASEAGFRVKKAKGGFGLIYVGGGPGLSIDTFFELMNYNLKSVKVPGDELFIKPRFNGRVVSTSATIGGILYIVEVQAGRLHVTKILMKTKKQKQQKA